MTDRKFSAKMIARIEEERNLIMNELLDILQELHPEIDFETHDALIDKKVLDSFDIVTLISEINNEFDVAIPAEEIIPDNFNSAKALWALVERLLDEE